MPKSGDKLVDMRTWRNEAMGARNPEGVTLVGIPGTERRPQNPRMAASAGAFAIFREINI